MKEKYAEAIKELEYYNSSYRCPDCMSSRNINTKYNNNSKNNIKIYCSKCSSSVANINLNKFKEVEK